MMEDCLPGGVWFDKLRRERELRKAGQRPTSRWRVMLSAQTVRGVDPETGYEDVWRLRPDGIEHLFDEHWDRVLRGDAAEIYFVSLSHADYEFFRLVAAADE